MTESIEAVTPGWQFASDNTAGICPEAWQALSDANAGYAASYGADHWTQAACEAVRTLFEHERAQVFLVFNGTAANSLALASMTHSYHGIVCHEASHVQTDECAAPEFFCHGAKLLPLPGADAKLTADALAALIARRRDVHFPKPRAVTLSQPTEWGTLYSAADLSAISAVAHAHGLWVHVDGARFANALAAAPSATAAQLSWRAGVDVLSLGGTKNGLNSTEMLVFFQPELALEFDYRCKQAAQLASKMRFQSCQWQRVLETGAWLRHAAHANQMAAYLARTLESIAGVRLARRVEVNAVFVQLDARVAEALFALGWHFYVLGEAYRLMCSWATRTADIERLAADLRAVLAAPASG